MRITLFCHSVLSDWNHGNAHFLRGLVSELVGFGHSVRVFEQRDGWSVKNLIADQGEVSLQEVRRVYPDLDVTRYRSRALDLDAAVSGADLVVVHEWSDPELVRRIGEAKRAHGFLLFFHDTHHRSVTDPAALAAFHLEHYDAVLAFGEVVRNLYVTRGWARRAFTFHEAADVRVFRPLPEVRPELDLVWVGNWGDDEREAELQEFLLEPVRRMRLRARVHGVRYPERARQALRAAGIEYAGWLPNYLVPEAFARAKLTLHIPRRPYARRLPGIPTIRPFEALACGTPLVSAPWSDDEGLFRSGEDLLYATNGEQMCDCIEEILTSTDYAAYLSRNGQERIRERHTCAHRARQLLGIVSAVRGSVGNQEYSVSAA